MLLFNCLLFVFLRRNTAHLDKNLAKILGIIEHQHGGNLLHGVVLQKQLLRQSDLSGSDILVGRHIELFLEHAVNRSLANEERRREKGNVHLLHGQIFLNEIRQVVDRCECVEFFVLSVSADGIKYVDQRMG